MSKFLLTIGTVLSVLSPLAASAAPANTVRLGNTLTAVTFCEGVRLDRTMTYAEFLREFALDLKAQDAILNDRNYGLTENLIRLAQAKYERYKVTSGHVRDGQRHLCGTESPNWND